MLQYYNYFSIHSLTNFSQSSNKALTTLINNLNVLCEQNQIYLHSLTSLSILIEHKLKKTINFGHPLL